MFEVIHKYHKGRYTNTINMMVMLLSDLGSLEGGDCCIYKMLMIQDGEVGKETHHENISFNKKADNQ